MTRRMTNRYNPYTLNTPIKLNESLVRMEVSKLTPKSNMLMKKMSMVMGVSLGRIPERDLLAAAREKVRLAPHSWQRVAVVPPACCTRDIAEAGRPADPGEKNPARHCAHDRVSIASDMVAAPHLLATLNERSYNTQNRIRIAESASAALSERKRSRNGQLSRRGAED